MDSKRKKIIIVGSLTALLILIGGGVSTLIFLDQTPSYIKAPLDSIKGLFSDKEKATAKKDAKPPGFGSSKKDEVTRTYQTRDGDNLWAIARRGKLVKNPWQWKTIVTQNRDKIDYVFLSTDTGEWKVVMEKNQELVVRNSGYHPDSGPVEKKFALQLISLPENRKEHALTIVKTLLRGNVYAYLSGGVKDGQPILRVRSGFFESREQAQKMAGYIQKQFSTKDFFQEKFFVVVPSDRELRGEILDFGVQRVRPWVVQLPHRDSHQKALEDFKEVVSNSDFAYIAQLKSNPTGVFHYRIRVGYFDTREKAKTFLDDQWGDIWEGAKIVNLSGFIETLPGQRLKM